MSRRKPSQPQQQPRERRGARQTRPPDRPDREERPAPLWLFGQHAVLAALDNPRRRLKRLVALPQMAERLAEWRGSALAPEILDKTALELFLPPGASHQGLAVLSDPLKAPDLAEILEKSAQTATARPLLVLLDQVTDPRNCGAVLRSAAAFGASAVIAPQDSSAPESGALAKAASGALELIPYIQVTNLARALEQIKKAGFWCLGLAGEAERSLAEADPGGPIALVFGAEGSGLRRLTRERCDLLVRLPTAGPIDSLNVSNAAAVALYIASGRR
ncbi:MAG: 23S rRNA (guanosine(2251)-2'-O)-methyltransferase RlmB [Kiloniellales bacterium]